MASWFRSGNNLQMCQLAHHKAHHKVAGLPGAVWFDQSNPAHPNIVLPAYHLDLDTSRQLPDSLT
jgi:hypothetical protein